MKTLLAIIGLSAALVASGETNVTIRITTEVAGVTNVNTTRLIQGSGAADNRKISALMWNYQNYVASVPAPTVTESTDTNGVVTLTTNTVPVDSFAVWFERWLITVPVNSLRDSWIKTEAVGLGAIALVCGGCASSPRAARVAAGGERLTRITVSVDADQAAAEWLLQIYGTRDFVSWYPVTNVSGCSVGLARPYRAEFYAARWTNAVVGLKSGWSGQ